jgi:hypothetical protein
MPRTHLLALVLLLVPVRAGPAGVLLGEKPTHPDADVRDLTWTTSGDSIRLVVVAAGPGGTTVERPLPPLPRGLVRQALRYAADGRPMTVTVINTKPLVDQKVLLHPALVDTPLGRDALQLDMLVRRYAKPLWDEAAEKAYRQHALYQLAWAARVRPALGLAKALAPFLKAPETDEDRRRQQAYDALLAALGDHADQLAKDAEVRKRAQAALGEVKPGAGAAALLRAKSEFYDRDLVDALGKPGGGLDAVMGRIAQEGDRFAVDLRELDAREKQLVQEVKQFNQAPEPTNRFELQELQNRERLLREKGIRFDADLKRTVGAAGRFIDRALTPPPEITVPSGVREYPFAGRVGDFVPAADAPALPFRFMVQVVFETRPGFLEKGRPEDYSDTNPFELTQYETALGEAVRAGIQRDPDAARTVEHMAQFTRLQRLFRAGLAGALGPQFRRDRLKELAAALGPQEEASGARTLRWSPAPGALEALAKESLTRSLAALEKEDTDAARQAVGVLKECLSLVEEAIAARARLQEDLRRLAEAGVVVPALAGLAPSPRLRPDGLLEAARAARWDAFSAEQDGWLQRWTRAAARLTPAGPAAGPVSEAARTVASLDYAFQVRHKMRVLDDERLAEEQGLARQP